MRKIIYRVLCYTGFGIAIIATYMRNGITSALFCLATFLIVTAIIEAVTDEINKAGEDE